MLPLSISGHIARVNVMSVDYRGPISGYSSDAKQNYRFKVWSAIAPRIKHHFESRSRSHVLLMPSVGGEEIEVAISCGIPEDRIIAVDENPALIASAKWRKTRPLVKCYGSSLSRAAERIAKDGHVLSAANLDLCNNFSEDLVSEVAGFFSSATRFDEFCFSVTVMKGRENKATNLMLNYIFKNSDRGLKKIDDKRIRALCAVMVEDPSFPLIAPTMIVDQGAYTHSKTPMAWCVFASGFTSNLRLKARTIKEMCDKFHDAELEFYRSKPMRLDGVDKSWPEHAEARCIKEAKEIVRRANDYDKALRDSNFIDETCDDIDRFFLADYGQHILKTLSDSSFHKWHLGLSLR